MNSLCCSAPQCDAAMHRRLLQEENFRDSAELMSGDCGDKDDEVAVGEKRGIVEWVFAD